VIKAAMLRTCGVTGDEFRGAAGHSLRALMEQTGLRSPVPIGELERLSKAYLRTRYAPFPPQGVPTAPFANYSASEAAEAVTCAAALVDWGRSTEQVEPSLTARSQDPEDIAMAVEDV
jgi:HEPN domain-containing protein